MLGSSANRVTARHTFVDVCTLEEARGLLGDICDLVTLSDLSLVWHHALYHFTLHTYIWPCTPTDTHHWNRCNYSLSPEFISCVWSRQVYKFRKRVRLTRVLHGKGTTIVLTGYRPLDYSYANKQKRGPEVGSKWSIGASRIWRPR